MSQKEPIFNITEPSILVMSGALIIIHLIRGFYGNLEEIYLNFALLPWGFPQPTPNFHEYYSLASHGLLHADWNHVFMNVGSLLIFGLITFRGIRALKGEGRKGFILFWALVWIGVIIGGIAQQSYWAVLGTDYASAVGISGGVSAVFAAAGWVMGGRQRLYQFTIIFVLLNAAMVFLMGNIAWAAHAGGFLAGAVLAYFWAKPLNEGTSIFR